MNTTALKAALAAGLIALLPGNAAAQDDSGIEPSGFESITIPNGFSYAGLRYHEAAVAHGVVVGSPRGPVITVAGSVVEALVVDTTYIFEVTSGQASGATVLVDSFSADADTITLSDDISADFVDGDTFTIRPAATLASVFGVDNSAGIDGSFAPSSADQIWVPNGAGGFDKYFYENLGVVGWCPCWMDADTGETIDARSVSLIYTDAIVILGAGTDQNSFLVTGFVKLTETSFALKSGYNYLSSVSPSGATLASMFDPIATSGLAAGNGGPAGADQIWIPREGGYDKYYFDEFNLNTFAPAWTDVHTTKAIDPTTISLDDSSGLIVLNPGPAKQILGGVPGFYQTL